MASEQRTIARESTGWIVGGGDMGALMRATDWSKTKLGPVEHWPKSLRTMLGVVLGSRFPMLLWWGPEMLHLYNDAYRPILRDKHPLSLAAPAAEIWAEVWDVAGPMAEGVLHGGPATWTEDLQLFIASGEMSEETYFTFSYSPVPGDDGGVGGVLNTVQETTKKVQGERQIRMLNELSLRAADVKSESQAFSIAIAALADNALDLPFSMLYVVDEKSREPRLVGHNGWPTYAEPATPWPFAEALHGEVVVDDLAERFCDLPIGRWDARPQRAVVLPLSRAGGSPYAYLVCGVSPHRVLDERYRRFFRATADQVMTVVTTARTYESERRRAESLVEIDRAKTAFFSNISHEFRTPLTLMLGPTQDALASPAQSLSGDALQMVHRNVLRLMKLVNSLLEFSRVESGRSHASYLPSDLSAMTSYLAGAFRSAIERTGLRFDVQCPPLPEPIYVDPDLWEKIVLNLLSNALKFTFEGSIAVTTSWHDDHVEVAVRDTGTGIPESELPQLFERFHRVHGTKSRSHEGSGIGLALVHDLVQQHGGSISVESTVGRGTTFTVRLPRGHAHLPAERVSTQPSQTSNTQTADAFVGEATRWSNEPSPANGTTEQRDVRILVVDDNVDVRDYIVNLLKNTYEVETAVDGVAALAAARRQPPSLILSDVMMPRLDGFGLLRHVRADRKLRDVPIILLSARAGEEATVDGLQAGADDYLVKPFAARELLARVGTHVELARQRSALAEAKDVAEAANKELEAFSYSVAHDLRAPLRSIDGFSHALLEDYAETLDTTGQKYLGFVRESAQHMAHLIDDLLVLSRVSRGELQHAEVDLSALARTTMGRQVDVRIADGLRCVGDARLLGLLLDNLLGNAWKFTSKRVDASIEFDVRDDDGRSVYFVRDNGAGFDMAQASKLFGAFQRLHTSREFEGTGIGLATVQRVINRHHGRVWAEGEVDRGATFYFSLRDG